MIKNNSGCTLLLLLFIALKLTHVIAWSWLWVLAPFWIPAGVVLVIFLFGVLGIALWSRY